MNTRQHEVGQENAVMYLWCLMLLKGMKKDMGFCVCCKLILTITVPKPVKINAMHMWIDAPGTIQNYGMIYSNG